MFLILSTVFFWIISNSWFELPWLIKMLFTDQIIVFFCMFCSIFLCYGLICSSARSFKIGNCHCKTRSYPYTASTENLFRSFRHYSHHWSHSISWQFYTLSEGGSSPHSISKMKFLTKPSSYILLKKSYLRWSSRCPYSSSSTKLKLDESMSP